MKQYHKIQKEKLFYFAGLFDGEGCICIVKNKSPYKNRTYVYRAFIQLAMTDKRPIDWLKKNIGGNIYKVKGHKYCQKDYFQWTMNCIESAKFLDVVLEMFLVKKEQAKNLILFAKTIKRTGVGGTPENIYKIREKLYLDNKVLNQKGIIIK